MFSQGHHGDGWDAARVGGAVNFLWRGVMIPDIDAWAKARHEQMIRYRATREVPNVCFTRMITGTEEGEMPESFWNSLLMKDGWFYYEIGRRTP